ncbi:MAG: GntR family transcriptional regulator [Candidatus Neomarinimicrobiota bacterium]
MRLALLPDSPLPLYQQITEAISFKIATGRLSTGDSLPPIRDLARMLGVNMHTVHRAYRELVSKGLAESKVPQGTRVTGQAGRPPSGHRDDSLERFLDRVIHEGRQKYRLSSFELAHRLANWSATQPVTGTPVYVIECNESQCLDHARQIEEAWQVDARPWCLHDHESAPPSPAIATYYHYDEIRQRWPESLPDIHFVTILPDPSIVNQVKFQAPARNGSTVTICETAYRMATNLVIDLTPLLSREGYTIETRIVKTANELLSSTDTDTPLIFSPQLWSALTRQEQADPRVIRMYYGIKHDDLENLGRHLDWSRRRANDLGFQNREYQPTNKP